MRRDPVTLDRARELRRNETAAEKRIWSRLRAHRFLGFKFRRQFPIGRYVVDFVCLSAHLVIEIDGDSHSDDRAEALDAARTAWLETQGFRVVRFWNHDVIEGTDDVMESIFYALEGSAVHIRAPLPNPLPCGEREMQARAPLPNPLPCGEREMRARAPLPNPLPCGERGI
jgi:very-short-patch-repair endonuclease